MQQLKILDLKREKKVLFISPIILRHHRREISRRHSFYDMIWLKITCFDDSAACSFVRPFDTEDEL